MKECESSFFQLVDAHARLRYGCFLAEFFTARGDPTSFHLCFRSSAQQSSAPNASNPAAANYVTVAGSVVEADGGAGHLSEELVDLLHDKLG
jgi:hypothetical protein